MDDQREIVMKKIVVVIETDELIPLHFEIDDTELNEKGLRKYFEMNRGEYEVKEESGRRTHIFYTENGYHYDARFIVE